MEACLLAMVRILILCDLKDDNDLLSVEPSPPKLELLVAGSSVEDVKVGDWVVVSCQARGGNPIPDIDLIMDDGSFSAKDTKQFKNTFTFQATEEMNGRTVQCTASNKMGESKAEKTLTILSKFCKIIVNSFKCMLCHHQVGLGCNTKIFSMYQVHPRNWRYTVQTPFTTTTTTSTPAVPWTATPPPPSSGWWMERKWRGRILAMDILSLVW